MNKISKNKRKSYSQKIIDNFQLNNEIMNFLTSNNNVSTNNLNQEIVNNELEVNSNQEFSNENIFGGFEQQYNESENGDESIEELNDEEIDETSDEANKGEISNEESKSFQEKLSNEKEKNNEEEYLNGSINTSLKKSDIIILLNYFFLVFGFNVSQIKAFLIIIHLICNINIPKSFKTFERKQNLR